MAVTRFTPVLGAAPPLELLGSFLVASFFALDLLAAGVLATDEPRLAFESLTPTVDFLVGNFLAVGFLLADFLEATEFFATAAFLVVVALADGRADFLAVEPVVAGLALVVLRADPLPEAAFRVGLFFGLNELFP